MGLFSWKKNKEDKKQETDDSLFNESQMLFARLLFDSEPVFEDDKIEQNLSKYFKDFESSKTDSNGAVNSSSRHYFFNEFTVNYNDGNLPGQCVIFKPEPGDHIQKNLSTGYKQLWHWQDAKEKTKNCQYELVLNDLLTRPLDYKKRVELFQKFVCAVAEALKPVAIYFPTSEKLVEPTEYIDNVLNPQKDVLHGLLNVRLFNIQSGGILMDTVGLNGLGLPDFQFQFTNLDPSQAAGLLHSYAYYIYSAGSVIKNGNTVEGLEEGSRWACVYSSSLVEPTRNVLDIKMS